MVFILRGALDDIHMALQLNGDCQLQRWGKENCHALSSGIGRLLLTERDVELVYIVWWTSFCFWPVSLWAHLCWNYQGYCNPICSSKLLSSWEVLWMRFREQLRNSSIMVHGIYLLGFQTTLRQRARLPWIQSYAFSWPLVVYSIWRGIDFEND